MTDITIIANVMEEVLAFSQCAAYLKNLRLPLLSHPYRCASKSVLTVQNYYSLGFGEIRFQVINTY